MSLENDTPFDLEAYLSEETPAETPKDEAPPSASPAEEGSESTEPKSDDAKPPISDEPIDPEKLMEELSLNDPAIRELLRQQQQPAQPYPQQQYAPQAYAPPVPQYVPQAPPQSDNEGEYFDFTDPVAVDQRIEARVQQILAPINEKMKQQEALIQQQAFEAQASALEETVFLNVEQLNPELGKLIRDTKDPKAQALGEFGAKAYLAEIERYKPELRNDPRVIQNVTKAMLKDPVVKALVDAFIAQPKPKQVAPTQGYGGTAPKGMGGGDFSSYKSTGRLEDFADAL
jgi:hypothetical protein